MPSEELDVERRERDIQNEDRTRKSLRRRRVGMMHRRGKGAAASRAETRRHQKKLR